MDEADAAGGAAGVVRLNLGAGGLTIPGFQNFDRKTGQEIFPLAVPDGSVDEIRASHVLEHFPHGQIAAVLADWVRALKPGGTLKIAVPDFEVIVGQYQAGAQIPVQGYLMGGQVDGDDYHKAIFDRDELYQMLRKAGLIAIRQWTSEIQDCAALPISLNLMGTKPRESGMKFRAIMSVPRLGFMDNFFCAQEALQPNGIKLATFQGAYWEACLTRGIESAIADGADVVMTIDYDTVYTPLHVARMAQIMRACPEIDALAPIQIARHHVHPMLTAADALGRARSDVTFAEMHKQDLFEAETAHFGLTMIRASALARMPKPWFHGQPDPDGGWGEGRSDADVGFWRKWKACGNRLFIATRIAVGHAELLIRWPGKDLSAVVQYTRDFRDKGPPKECWE